MARAPRIVEDKEVVDTSPKPVCLITITGPVKGHPPITIEAYGRNPKEAQRALDKLVKYGKLTVLS